MQQQAFHDPRCDLLVKGFTNHFLPHPNNSFKYRGCLCCNTSSLIALCVCTSQHVPSIHPRPSALAYCQTVSKYNHFFISLFTHRCNLVSEMEEELVCVVSGESEWHRATRVLRLCKFWPRKTQHEKTRQKDHPPVGVHQHPSRPHRKLS